MPPGIAREKSIGMESSDRLMNIKSLFSLASHGNYLASACSLGKTGQPRASHERTLSSDRWRSEKHHRGFANPPLTMRLSISFLLHFLTYKVILQCSAKGPAVPHASSKLSAPCLTICSTCCFFWTSTLSSLAACITAATWRGVEQGKPHQAPLLLRPGR